MARTAWRGRWRAASSLEMYLQEVVGENLLLDLTENDRLRIQTFADAAPRILAAVLSSGSLALWEAQRLRAAALRPPNCRRPRRSR